MTRVDPDSLRAAGRAIGDSPSTGSGAVPGTVSFSFESMSIEHGAMLDGRPTDGGIAGTATAAAITEAIDGAARAIDVVQGRLGAWSSILSVSADTYQGAEDTIVARIDEIGDFNGSSDRR